MDEDAWNNDKIQAFYECAAKSKESLNVTDDTILQCWRCIQTVTSLNELSFSSVHFKGLVRNSKVQSFYLERPEYWSRLGSALLKIPLSDDEVAFLDQLVQRIIDTESQSHAEFLENVWMKRDKIKLPLRTLEQIIKENHGLLETSLRILLLREIDSLPAKTLWSLPKNSIIIKLSADSSVIFQASTSIMNEMLIKTNLNSKVMEMIRIFVKGTKSVFRTDLAGFVALYPPEFQLLVMFLLNKKHARASQIELDAINIIINNKLSELLTNNFEGFLCLATHFPASAQRFKNVKSES